MKATTRRNRRDSLVAALEEFRQLYGTELEHPVTKKFNPIRALAKAVEVNNVTVYSVILQIWLESRGVPAPRGVFRLELDAGRRPGRKPKSDEAFKIWQAYVTMVQPTFHKVAKKLFPAEYKKNGKKVADRVRQLYLNHAKEFWANEMLTWMEPKNQSSEGGDAVTPAPPQERDSLRLPHTGSEKTPE